jgi:hypothetical protein
MDELETDLRRMEKEIENSNGQTHSKSLCAENVAIIAKMQLKLASFSNFVPNRTLCGVSRRIERLVSLCGSTQVLPSLCLDQPRNESIKDGKNTNADVGIPNESLTREGNECGHIRKVRDDKVAGGRVCTSIMVDRYVGEDKIFLEPCKGPVFLRNLRDRSVYLACQQLRLLNCRGITVKCVRCATQPVLEKCTDVTFVDISSDDPEYSYPELDHDLLASDLLEVPNRCMDSIDFDNL